MTPFHTSAGIHVAQSSTVIMPAVQSSAAMYAPQSLITDTTSDHTIGAMNVVQSTTVSHASHAIGVMYSFQLVSLAMTFSHVNGLINSAHLMSVKN